MTVLKNSRELEKKSLKIKKTSFLRLCNYGTTYTEAEEKELKEIKNKQGFYDGKEHD